MLQVVVSQLKLTVTQSALTRSALLVELLNTLADEGDHLSSACGVVQHCAVPDVSVL